MGVTGTNLPDIVRSIWYFLHFLILPAINAINITVSPHASQKYSAPGNIAPQIYETSLQPIISDCPFSTSAECCACFKHPS